MTASVDNLKDRLAAIEDRLAGGGEIVFREALALTDLAGGEIALLTRTADNVRRRFTGNDIDLCSIINARSGRCPEDCKFCTQSSLYNTKAPVYGMKSVAEITTAAKRAEEAGAHRFCIVTSGESLPDADFDTVVEAVSEISRGTNLKRCASIGALTAERAARLREAGLNRYHHNVETASGFFDRICTTHGYADKIDTIRLLDKTGIEKCVGGILNLGESPRQRIEFAFELKKIDPISVPINFLDPRPGTPMADRPRMDPLEALKYLAVFRLILPGAYIRLAGGRADTFGSRPESPFQTGVNALLIGDLLTTSGPDTRRDIAMLGGLGFNTAGDSDEGC